jgi:hypothetical protein
MLDGAPKQGLPRSFLAPLPRGGSRLLFHPPSGRIAEEEQRSGEGQRVRVGTEWSMLDGLQNKALPARSSRPSQGEGEVVFFTLP